MHLAHFRTIRNGNDPRTAILGLGVSPLARLRRQPRCGAGAAVLCDRHGCDQPGNCPAPKSPNSPEWWYFCQKHAAEYNAGWDYFAGLTAEEAAERETSERSENAGYREAAHYGWAGSGDGSRSRDELRALDLLGCALSTPSGAPGAARP